MLFLNEHYWHTPCFDAFNEKYIPFRLIAQKIIIEHRGAGEGVVHLLTIICLAMGILEENEREYLRDDLKEVTVYGA